MTPCGGRRRAHTVAPFYIGWRSRTWRVVRGRNAEAISSTAVPSTWWDGRTCTFVGDAKNGSSGTRVEGWSPDDPDRKEIGAAETPSRGA